ncbi:Sugar lactone lactonase YvrE [Terriglobus roseus]|uniref:Sugar lactone lactonase YvrE n=2 Tax=Terriglobus roseus TaxID=392734 RepID=A0A1H4K653_9BACT|nr:Sugar lactone lactonase YvrE [Terriglobus roseus]
MKTSFRNAVLVLPILFSGAPLLSYGQVLAHDIPVGHLEQVATFNGPMPTGVTVSRTNRIFVNFPRWGDDVPFTVAEVINGKAVPFPDPKINDWPGRNTSDPTQYKDQGQNESHFVSVQSVVVDPANRLWVLDTGSPMLKNALPGGPKLVAIDLATNKVVKRILLPSSVAGPTSYMNDVRFDLRIGSPAGPDGIHGIAYITDSSEKGPTGFVVVDLATGQSWRKLDDIDAVKPELGFLMFAEGRPLYKTEPGKPAKPGIFANDSLAISADGSKLFFCPVSSTKLYSVPTAALRDKSLTAEATAKQVALVTGKESSDGLESDAGGNVYSTAPASGSILKISPNSNFAGGVEVSTLVHDPRLLWPDTMSLSDDGYLYVTANQLFNQPSMHNGKDLRQKPYTLFRVKVDAKPVRLQ